MLPELPMKNSKKALFPFINEETETLPIISKIVNPFWIPGYTIYSLPGNATTYNLIKKLSTES